MKNKGKHFTEEEDKLIIDTISNKDKCLNLSQTFRELAKDLGRSHSSINLRWYTVLSNKEHAFNLKSKKKQTSNVKNKKDETFVNENDMACNRKVKSFEPFLKYLSDNGITECGSNKLYSLYIDFCKNNGYFPYKQREFVNSLLLKGFERKRLNKGTIYRFVGNTTVSNNSTDVNKPTNSNKSIDAILHLIERLSYSEKENLTYKLIHEL